MANQTIRVSLCLWILVGILITAGFKREETGAIAAFFKNPRSTTDTCLSFFTEYLAKYLCIEHIIFNNGAFKRMSKNVFLLFKFLSLG